MFCLGDFHFWTPLSPQGKHTHQNTPTARPPNSPRPGQCFRQRRQRVAAAHRGGLDRRWRLLRDSRGATGVARRAERVRVNRPMVKVCVCVRVKWWKEVKVM